MKLTKSELNFLRKIEDKKVYRAMGYTRRRGAYTTFVGGEGTFLKLRGLGLAAIGVPSLGLRAFATLTPAGRAALEGEERT
jgi:hypothetical protein